MISIDKLKFDANGLIPAVVQDAYTKKVLTVAYMNKESLEISMRRRLTCFYSRTRKTLWLKGETSGNFQHIVSITADCDMDSLTILVVKDGPACHLGTDSCFTNTVYVNTAYEDEEFPEYGGEIRDGEKFNTEQLYALLEDRKQNGKEGSYTTYLFEKGKDKILKKIGEESTEVIVAAKGGDNKETVYEIADLAYHIMVLMVNEGISLQDVREELASRHVVDKKVKQERMQ